MMLSTLRNWIARRRQTRQRAIFRFFDGSELKTVDPFEAYRVLSCHPRFNWSTHPGMIDTGDWEALALTCQAVQEAFGVKPFDGKSGLSQEEMVELLVSFVAYTERQKKSGKCWLTSLFPTERPRSVVMNSTPMNAASDSGSTLVEPKLDVPAESLSV